MNRRKINYQDVKLQISICFFLDLLMVDVKECKIVCLHSVCTVFFLVRDLMNGQPTSTVYLALLAKKGFFFSLFRDGR